MKKEVVSTMYNNNNKYNVNISFSFSMLPKKINLSERAQRELHILQKLQKLQELQKFAILIIFIKFAVPVEPFWRFHSERFHSL